MVEQTVLNQTQQLLPEYQEAYLKSLLFSAFDPYAGNIVDAEGNIISSGATDPAISGETLPEGQSFVSAPTGLYTQSPLSNVPAESLAQFSYTDPTTGQEVTSGFTPAQAEALRMGIGQTGAYQPMFTAAGQTFNQGLGAFGEGVDMARLGGAALAGTGAEYDPTTYTDYYDPFVEEVIDQVNLDLDDQRLQEGNRINAGAVSAGAFGGSRQAVAQQELSRNTMREKSRIGSQLRSQAYGQAQTQAQSAFESAQQRGQNAAQLFGSLGQGLGSLGQGLFGAGTTQMAAGEASQAAGTRDVNSLFNLGTLEQQQAQAELDVNRRGAMETAYEPFQRLAGMSDLFRGVPSLSSSMGVTSTPSKNPTQTFLGYGMGLSNMGGGGGLMGGSTTR
tara:strand:+ start:1760 stop:2929 length:1170 start_codon:yes stop_codon:yes gene_type:complete